MYKCIDCGYRGFDVVQSPTFNNCYLCDNCFTDRNDEREEENKYMYDPIQDYD